MLSKIYLVGANGNMGGRYKAILKYLRVPFKTCDMDHDQGIDGCDGILIATPTNTHEALVDRWVESYPVLCEKPIWTLPYNFYSRFEHLEDGSWACKTGMDYTKLRMLNQYQALLFDASGDKPSGRGVYYNYFKHGGDGLIFDTINIYGNMANFDVDSVELREDSPVWECQIDGYKLNLSDMDHAYIRTLYDWITDPRGNMQYACEAHHRAFRLLEQFK